MSAIGRLGADRLALVVGLLAIATAGCKGEFKDICQRSIDCEGGNDKDVAACVDQGEGAEDQASDYGCGSQFDDYYDCIDKNLACQANKDFSAGGKCDAQEKALNDCQKAASSRKR